MSSTININVKLSSNKYVIAIETDKTVLDLKNAIAKETEVPAENQRLIYSGRILKDPVTIEECKIADGHTVHMVKSGGTSTKASTSNSTTSSTTTASANSAPISQPQQPPTTQQAPNSNPFAGFAGMPADSQSNPFNMFGSGFGAGAMGNSFGSMMDPNMMNQMLQNPMFAQYMSGVLQNPAVLDSIIQSNPQLSTMGPEIRAMMQSPEFRQMLSNPDMIRQMATMASAMQGMGGAGAAGNPFAAMAQQQQQQQQSPSSTNATNATNASGTTSQQQPQNPFASFGNVPPVDPQLQQRMAALFGFGGGVPGAAADTRSPEERFQVQLQQLNDMGFWDAAKNIRALQATGGNVEAAIEMLFSGNL